MIIDRNLELEETKYPLCCKLGLHAVKSTQQTEKGNFSFKVVPDTELYLAFPETLLSGWKRYIAKRGLEQPIDGNYPHDLEQYLGTRPGLE